MRKNFLKKSYEKIKEVFKESICVLIFALPLLIAVLIMILSNAHWIAAIVSTILIILSLPWMYLVDKFLDKYYFDERYIDE